MHLSEVSYASFEVNFTTKKLGLVSFMHLSEVMHLSDMHLSKVSL